MGGRKQPYIPMFSVPNLLTFLFLLHGSVASYFPSTYWTSKDSLYEEDPLLVQTASGLVRGTPTSYFGTEVHTFLGIPFAKPPVDELRFRKPEPVNPWTDILEASSLPNSCMQGDYNMFPDFQGEKMWKPNTPTSEDCLYLNLWVPAHLRNNQSAATTLIWIHGGGFVSGTSTLDLYDGGILSATNDVIVVSMQYRVGALGFLHLGIEEVPGNVGLYDQALAIRWIKDNIAFFGGNSESLVLFGESAGSASVNYHLLSPISRSLVKRAILQSGSSNAPWSFVPPSKAKESAILLASKLGCNTTVGDDYTDMVECMRGVSVSALLSAAADFFKTNLRYPFVPTIDGTFLPANPVAMLQEGNFSRVDVLLGSNLDEGTFFLPYDFPQYFNKDNRSSLSRENLTDAINSAFDESSQLVRDAIAFQYTNWNQPHDSYGNQKMFADCLGDYNFVCPVNSLAEKFTERGLNVYYYHFIHRSSSNPWGEWMGVMHADEIEYVFGRPLYPSLNYTAAEKDLSRRMTKHFTTFAKTGKPTTDKSRFQWPIYSSKNQEYYVYDTKINTFGRGPRAKACAFWNDFIPKINHRLAETKCSN